MATNIVQMTDGTGNKQYPVTSAEAVGMPDGSGNLTNYLDKRVTEYNVSVLHPTSGSGGSNKYTLETAIAQVPAQYRTIGIKCSFINETGQGETWEYIGSLWTSSCFLPLGAKRLAVLDSNSANNIMGVIGYNTKQFYNSISPDSGSELIGTGERIFVEVKPNTKYRVRCSLELSQRFGAYAQYRSFDRNQYIEGTLVTQEAGRQDYDVSITTTSETTAFCFSSKDTNISLVIYEEENGVYKQLTEINKSLENQSNEIQIVKIEAIGNLIFDITNEKANTEPSSFIKGIQIELLDTNLLPKDLSNIKVHLNFVGISTDKYQISTTILGFTKTIGLSGDFSKFDEPTEDLSVVEIGNSEIKIKYLLYKPNFPKSSFTYNLSNSKFSDSAVIPQIAKYSSSGGQGGQVASSNIFVKSGLEPINTAGNVYLENIVRFIKIDNYDFASNGEIVRFRVNFIEYNTVTRQLYVSYNGVKLSAEGTEQYLFNISGRDENTQKVADENGLAYFDFEGYNGLKIKALYDVSNIKSNIGVTCTLKNGEFSEYVTLSSKPPTETESIDYPTDYTIYISNKSTENCAHNMCQVLDWNKKTPRFNMALACDFHQEVRCFEDLCYWTKDKAIETCLSSIVVAGDYLSSGQAYTEEQWKEKAKAVIDATRHTNKPVLFCQGNHDKNWEQAGNNPTLVMSDAIVKENIYMPAYNRLSETDKQNFHFPDNGVEDALYYYFDQDINGKIFRYLVINEYDLPETLNENGVRKYSGTADYTGKVTTAFATYISQKQFEFIKQVLTDTPDEYIVLFVRHTPSGDTPLANSGTALKGIVKAYKEKTSGSVTIDALDDIPSYTINYDFSSKSESHIIVINGHSHETWWKEDASYGTLRLQGTCLGTSGNNARFLNSSTEANCDILSIDTSKNEAYLLRYGVAKIVENQEYFSIQNVKIL